MFISYLISVTSLVLRSTVLPDHPSSSPSFDRRLFLSLATLRCCAFPDRLPKVLNRSVVLDGDFCRFDSYRHDGSPRQYVMPNMATIIAKTRVMSRRLARDRRSRRSFRSPRRSTGPHRPKAPLQAGIMTRPTREMRIAIPPQMGRNERSKMTRKAFRKSIENLMIIPSYCGTITGSAAGSTFNETGVRPVYSPSVHTG